MNYSEKLKESKSKIYNQAIGAKILDLMDKLRMNSEKGSERRWIWELLQNAKDVAREGSGVSARINLNVNGTSSTLEFSHNGRPFSIDNISFLIEQVSTKDREVKEGEKRKESGKFGTGFLTTHLLSEQVELSGVVKEPLLPYRKFGLTLDRSGSEIDDVIKSIDESNAVLNNLDNQPPYEEFNERDFNTTFKYKLDEDGISIAKTGIQDLHLSLPYTLAFLSDLKKITLEHQGVEYEMIEEERSYELEGLSFVKIKKATLFKEEYIRLVILSNEKVSIAIEFLEENGVIHLKRISTETPRLFCDFPLIGTEDFYFPLIINSSFFNPTEPRNGIFLTDRENSKILENKSIIQQALTLFQDFISYASDNNWQNLHLLAECYIPCSKAWLSSDWYSSHILQYLRAKVTSVPIVDTTNNQRVPIKIGSEYQISFPSHKSESVRKGIWDLCNQTACFNIPREKDIDSWDKALNWSKKTKLTLKELTDFIESQKTVHSLSHQLGIDFNATIIWLNKYYALINKDEEALNLINLDQHAVIPNQSGVFCMKSRLFIDKEIEEELKNALSLLGKNWRDFLILKDIRTYQGIQYSSKTQENIIDEINKSLKTETDAEKLLKTCNYLVCIYSDDLEFPKYRTHIYEFYSTLHPANLVERKKIITWSDNIWEESDKRIINWIIDKISSFQSIQGLQKALEFPTYAEAKKWIVSFIDFLHKNKLNGKLNLKNSPILPNQNGDFRTKDNIFLDNGEIGVSLKDIANDLGHDFRNELLEQDVFLELSENRTLNAQVVADKINELIVPRFSEFPRSDETKVIFKNLYLWFTKNTDLSQKIFPSLYSAKHKLYDDEEIAESMQRAEEINNIMEEFSISDINDIRKALRRGTTSDEKEDKKEITQEVLISLGVTTEEELKEAMKDVKISSAYFHNSIPDLSLLRYVQGLIARVKVNVKSFLEKHEDYDCTEWEELAMTVIGGVRKNNEEIHIVLRPSDNGQVIIYSGPEKDTLLDPNSELWVENGFTDPEIITLGRVIKKTGINKFNI